MVLHHQIFSSRIPAPPLNTVLYCHCFLIYSFLLFSLIISFYLPINGHLLFTIPFYLFINCIGFLTPQMFYGVLIKYLRTRENFLRISCNIVRIREKFLRILKKFLRTNRNFFRTSLNFFRIKGKFLRINENFLRTKEIQLFHLLLIQNHHFLVLQLRNNGYLHCNYGERLSMPAR